MPPKSKQSSAKKQKTAEVSGSGTAEEFDATRFISAEHAERITNLEGRWFLSERMFALSREGQYGRVQRIFEKKRWGKLLQPVDRICYEIIREFYANALQAEGVHYTFTTFVRDASILLPGRSVKLNPKGEPQRYLRKDMTPEAQAVLLFLCYNVRPRDHRSTISLDTALLMYCILEDKEVDIARIIANEMKNFVENTRYLGTHDDAPIIFPCLVQALCNSRNVLAPNVPNEKLKGIIDDDYLNKYNKKNLEGGETAPDSMDFSSMSAAMRTCFNYSWDTAASLHRSNQFNFNCMQQIYNIQMYPEETAPFPSREDFDAYANWPGDRRPFFPEGAGPSGAGMTGGSGEGPSGAGMTGGSGEGPSGAGMTGADGGDQAGGSGVGEALGDDLVDEEIEDMFS